jgi:hypothetical protein
MRSAEWTKREKREPGKPLAQKQTKATKWAILTSATSSPCFGATRCDTVRNEGKTVTEWQKGNPEFAETLIVV